MNRTAFMRIVACWVMGLLAPFGCQAQPLGVATQCGDGRMEGYEECDLIVPEGTGCTELGFAGGTLSCTDTCQLDTSDCVGSAGSVCGDSLIGVGEECDGNNFGGANCATFGMVDGSLGCSSDCRFYTIGCHPVGVCGNNVLDAAEECDGVWYGGVTCEMLGFDAGELTCRSDCTFNESGCSSLLCGNGQIDPGEDCDGMDFAGITCQDRLHAGGSLACTANCRFDDSACCDHQCANEWLGHCAGPVTYECEMQSDGCMDWSTYDCSMVYMTCHESSSGVSCGYQ